MTEVAEEILGLPGVPPRADWLGLSEFQLGQASDILNLEKRSDGEGFTLSLHFPAVALSASHVLKGIELLETAAEGGRRVFLSWGQANILTPSSRNSEWHVLGSHTFGAQHTP